jgi:hypothetical protein
MSTFQSTNYTGKATLSTPPKAHHAQSSTNLALVEHIRQRGTCLYRDLFPLFGAGLDQHDSKLAHAKFRKKLEYLCYNDQLQAGIERGTRRVYSLGHLSDPADRPLSAAKAPDASGVDVPADTPTDTPVPDYVEAFSPARVPPRVYTGLPGRFEYRMADPVRPGAMDHKRYATHGHHC